DAPLWWSPAENKPSESFITVLKQDGNVLRQVGRVGEHGKGERIYAVRFLGGVGYVVTFRQIAPLYTGGLCDPEHRQVLGSVDRLLRADKPQPGDRRPPVHDLGSRSAGKRPGHVRGPRLRSVSGTAATGGRRQWKHWNRLYRACSNNRLTVPIWRLRFALSKS